MTDKHRHIICTGERCELCGEMSCPQDRRIVDGMKLCPVCYIRIVAPQPTRVQS